MQSASDGTPPAQFSVRTVLHQHVATRFLIGILLLTACLTTPCLNAATYYVDSSRPDDSGNGTSPATAWKTIGAVNGHSYQAGDFILFKCGGTYFGQLTPQNSGTSGNPITYGSYGAGAKPILTGFVTIPSWTNEGGNIYSANVSAGASVAIVTVGGVQKPMGRFPDTGWYTISSGGNSSLQGDMPTTNNFTGGTVVIKKFEWMIDRHTITSNSGSQINFYNHTGYPAQNGFGYFVQNHPATLSTQGEWCYNGSNSIKMYSTGVPANVQVATLDTLVTVSGRDYLVFDGLNLQGANMHLFDLRGVGITVQNCDLSLAGIHGIDTNFTQDLKVLNSSFWSINNQAIKSVFGTNTLVSGNSIINIGLIIGAGADDNESSNGMRVDGTGSLIEKNFVNNIAYCGINPTGTDLIVRKNYVQNYCLNVTDGGGIYSSDEPRLNKLIEDNICVYGYGNAEGTPYGVNSRATFGIYLDEAAAHFTVNRNTSAYNGYGSGGGGIYLHKAHDITMTNNTFYGNKSCQMRVAQDPQGGFPEFQPVRNNIFTNNICYAANPTDYIYWFYTTNPDEINLFFSSMDNNILFRPSNLNQQIRTYNWTTYEDRQLSFPQWKALFTSYDVHSTTRDSEARLEFNGSNSQIVVALGGNYTDVNGVYYPGSITLDPYKSAVLFAAAGQATPPSNLTAGLAYKYYDLSGISPSVTVLPNYDSLTPKRKGVHPMVNINVNPAPQEDYFGLRFDGFVNIPVDGTYKFYLACDDGAKLLIDGVQVLDNDGLHGSVPDLASGDIVLTAGLHTLRVDYFEAWGGQSVNLYWSSATIPKAEIPASALFSIPANTTQGLSYKYYDIAGTNPQVIPDLGSLIATSRGTVPTVSLIPAIQADNFAFRFEGAINVTTAGAYTFYLSSDDGSKLWIDGTLAVDNDATHGAQEVASSPIVLSSGLHSVRIDYFEAAGDQSLIFSWQGPGVVKQSVPADRLYLSGSFAQWRSDMFTTSELGNSAISGASADPEGDGIPNEMEYALGGNPRLADITNLPVFTIEDVGGTNYGILSFRRRTTATDLTYAVEASGSLSAWSSIDSAANMIGSPLALSPTLELVKVRDAVPLTGQSKRFMRLQVNKP